MPKNMISVTTTNTFSLDAMMNSVTKILKVIKKQNSEILCSWTNIEWMNGDLKDPLVSNSSNHCYETSSHDVATHEELESYHRLSHSLSPPIPHSYRLSLSSSTDTDSVEAGNNSVDIFVNSGIATSSLYCAGYTPLDVCVGYIFYFVDHSVFN